MPIAEEPAPSLYEALTEPVREMQRDMVRLADDAPLLARAIILCIASIIGFAIMTAALHADARRRRAAGRCGSSGRAARLPAGIQNSDADIPELLPAAALERPARSVRTRARVAVRRGSAVVTPATMVPRRPCRTQVGRVTSSGARAPAPSMGASRRCGNTIFLRKRQFSQKGLFLAPPSCAQVVPIS